MPGLERALLALLAAHAETIAVAFHDLQSGEWVEIRAREPMHAASTMKLAVLLAAFRLHADLRQPVRIENRFRSLAGGDFSVDPNDDDDPWPYAQRQATLGELLEHMIVRSSNLATNLVMQTLQPPAVQRVCDELGAKGMRILRGVEDLRAHQQGLDNLATAHDLALLLEAAPAEAVEILARQQFDEGIPAGVPRGTRVAHKTGDIDLHYHDAALVFPPGRKPYALVVMTRGFSSKQAGAAAVRDVSRAVWKSVVDPLR